MPSTINADTGAVSGITGIVQTADNSGNLTLQANGVSILTVNTANTVAVTGAVSATGNVTGNFFIGNGSLLTGISAGGGLTWASVQTANLTAVSGNAYPINTTSQVIYALLPSTPGAGNTVQFVDYAKTFATNNFIINPNGQKINANTANISLINNGMSVTLVYTDTTQGWIPVNGFIQPPTAATYAVNYLVVAGGGGGAGGPNGGGGGGAGGLLAASTTLTRGTTYNITVGGGGAGTNTNTTRGTNGSNSVFGALVTSVGGGGGGTGLSGTEFAPGAPGGSGGGAGRDANGGPGGAGTAGQGNPGGTTPGISYASGAGGGGAGAVGGNGSPNGSGPNDSGAGGNGGAGLSSSITGSATTYAGGGGGSAYQNTGGAGGSGGGGSGGNRTAGNAGTANLGGGGGGGREGTGGNGGSGIVILSIPTANYSGLYTGTPAVSTSGSNTILQFTASGSYTA